MLILTSPALSDTLGAIPAALDMSAVDVASPLTVQLSSGATANEKFDIYESNISPMTDVAQGQVLASVFGRGVIDVGSVRSRYLYAVRRGGSATGLTLLVTAQSSVGSISTSAWVQGGNTFGATGILGTSDAFNLELRANGSTRITITSAGAVNLASAVGQNIQLLSGGAAQVVGDGALIKANVSTVSIEAETDAVITSTTGDSRLQATAGDVVLHATAGQVLIEAPAGLCNVDAQTINITGTDAGSAIELSATAGDIAIVAVGSVGIEASGGNMRLVTNAGPVFDADPQGRVVIGAGGASSPCKFEVRTTTQGSQAFPHMTTAEENILAALLGAGDVGLRIYNTTLGEVREWTWAGVSGGAFNNMQLKAAFSAYSTDLALGLSQAMPAGGQITATSPIGMIQKATTVRELRWSFRGNPLNVGGQTAHFVLGYSTDGGATIVGLAGSTLDTAPVSAGVGWQHGKVVAPSAGIADGSMIFAHINLSAPLTGPLGNLALSLY